MGLRLKVRGHGVRDMNDLAEVRYNDDGTVDEIVTLAAAFVQIEQMGDQPQVTHAPPQRQFGAALAASVTTLRRPRQEHRPAWPRSST